MGSFASVKIRRLGIFYEQATGLATQNQTGVVISLR
jgi:hypothetical protein